MPMPPLTDELVGGGLGRYQLNNGKERHSYENCEHAPTAAGDELL